MNERTIFCEALEKPTTAERSVFLDRVCAGNDALRQRVEALLKSEAEAGNFLAKLAPERVAEELAAPLTSTRTLGEPAACEADEDLGFLAPSENPDVLGRLGHYDILEVIGRGGMGVVLRAFDEKLHRMVAIKVMAPQLATNATARKRFTREAQAQAAVSHDHVVTIYAVEEANGLPYLVMQFVDGISLQEQLNRGGPLELAAILRIGMQTAAGLAAAHAQGLIHRDIKPANILLENGVQRVKLTDFGLARAAADASLTQTGAVAGTPYYMSPEQARGEAVDQRSDLFSLGSVLYFACAGRVPFRAPDALAVLRRVCEDVPTPIGEVNREIPDWLVAIVDKLHAKDSTKRFQSAAEVAELLGRHLMHLQNPSAVPFPDAGKANATTRPIRRKRWAVAAAALVLMVLGLGTTEATGVTRFRSAVIRIFTPDGTLVVEADDPDVKITIEGDGGLLITGGGPQEVRVRPGSYRVQADKAGKSVRLDRDLVTITRGDKQVVRVRVEGTPTVGTMPKMEAGAFVALRREGSTERRFDTLADAVSATPGGDIIEIRGDGPFACRPVRISGKALTIRAGSGFRPVLDPATATADAPLLDSDASLTLEGLSFRRPGQYPETESMKIPIIVSRGAPIRAVNCLFSINESGMTYAIRTNGSPICEVRNCHFAGSNVHCAVECWRSAGGQLVADNCLFPAGRSAIALHLWRGERNQGTSVRLRHCSLAVVPLTLHYSEDVDKFVDADSPVRPVRVEAEENVMIAGPVFDFQLWSVKEMPLVFDDAATSLKHLVSWTESRNLYPRGGSFLKVRKVRFVNSGSSFKAAVGLTSLTEWARFWGIRSEGSLEGQIRFHGSDLELLPMHTAPPAEFRLREGAPGYRAGKAGKDLGADVGLVGPGAAYERWKKTPDYQRWLKDTGQKPQGDSSKLPEAPNVEPGAFVVLGPKGVGGVKFGTLIGAVQAARSGDTIEIQGNGPFITDPVAIGVRSLIIKAGSGFRPVIRLSERGAQTFDPMIVITGSLVLEGIELQRLGQRQCVEGQPIPPLC